MLVASSALLADKEKAYDYCCDCTNIAVESYKYQGNEACNAFFVTLDYIYWQAQPRPTGSLYTDTPDYISGDAADFTSYTPIIFPTYKARSGLKVGLGTYVDWESIQLYAEYTWLSNKRNQNDYQTKALNSSDYDYGTIKNYYSNTFQRLDLLGQREFCLGAQLSATTKGGLILGFTDQRLGAINLDYNAPDEDLTASTYDKKINNHQRFWGIGPYMGVSSEAFILPMDRAMNASFIFEGGAGMPWSNTKFRETTLYPNITSSTITDGSVPASFVPGGRNIENHIWGMSPMVDMTLGFKWTSAFGPCDNRVFTLSAAYEQQIWFSHNFILSDTQISFSTLDYMIQGLTVSAKLDF